jgi:chromosome segregation ATPase
MEEMTAKDEMIREYNQLVANVTSITDKIREARKTIELVNKQLTLRDDEIATELTEKGRAIDKKLESLLYTVIEKPVQGFIRDHNKIAVQLGNAGYLLRSTLVPVSENQQVAMANLENSVADTMKPVNTFFTEEWPKYRNAVENSHFSIFNAYETGR